MATSGRYQSSLLNFLARQSLRIREQSSQTWRQVKLAATWGAQILVYPLYVAFQTTRLAGKQLRQTVRQVLPRLQAAQEVWSGAADTSGSPPMAADAPIQQTLEMARSLVLPASWLMLEHRQDGAAAGVRGALEEAPLVSRPETSSALAAPQGIGVEAVGNKPEIASVSGSSVLRLQGVASLLATRSLVLVTNENQVLDVLTREQQQHLQQRMSWEMAGYWRQQRSLARRSPALPVWVDRALPLPQKRVHALPPINAFYQLMAWVQTGPVAVAANLFQESQLLLSLPGVAPPPALPSLDLPLRSAQASWQALGQGVNQLFDRSKRLPGLVSIDRLWLRSLALARSMSSSLPSSSAIPASSSLPLEALPGSADLTPQQPVGWRQLLQAARFGWIHPPASRQQDLTGDHWPGAKLPQPLAPELRSPQTQTQLHGQPIVRATASTLKERVDASGASSSSPVAAPVWIEAEVKLVAYEKHPLEQLLEWLDRSIVWVEQKLEGVWQWLRDRWHR